MKNLHIITVATESKYYFPYLVDTCKKNGKDLIVLAFGEKWTGFNSKYKILLTYIKNLHENDIVCFVDGYDVLCLRNLDKLSECFVNIKNKYKCKIIVGYNNNMHATIVKKLIHYISFGTCNNIALNSGTYIGYVKDIIEYINIILNINTKDNDDDQVGMTKYCNNNKNDIYIDVNNEIFLCLDYPFQNINKYVEWKNGQLYYNNYPFFIHANGHGYLDQVLVKLNYKDPCIDNILYKNNYIFAIQIFLINYIFEFLIIIIIIIFAIKKSRNS